MLAVAGLVAAGCSSGPGTVARAGAEDGPVRDGAVPAALLGLRTQEEDVSAKLEEAGDKAYVSSVRFWSLREGDRLRATIQVARFQPDAPTETKEFRDRVAGQVGGTTPRLRLIGDDRVYVSAGNRQTFYGWFRGLYFVLLSVPADAENGRALARHALAEVHP